MNTTTSSIDHYLSEFAEIEGRLPGNSLPWLRASRASALDQFRTGGFPTPRNEDWKYTRVTPIEKRAFRPAAETCVGLLPEDLEAFFLNLDCHRLVFINGRYAPQLSQRSRLPRGITVTSLTQALNEQPARLEPHLAHYADPSVQGFSALNTAFMEDGACIILDQNTDAERPIHLLFVATAQSEEWVAQPRILVVAEDNSQAGIIESYESLGQSVYFNNTLTEVVLGSNARLDHYKVQRESNTAFHVSTLEVRQARNSRFQSHSISLGGALTRNDINVALQAEGAECTLNGLYMVAGRQHVDYHTRVDHTKPHCTSRELYKGVLNGRARGVFNGRVYVHPDAQKTDAQQSNSNLLLSKDAEIDTKPQLEIYADDVKCAHGATVGQLDETMIYYLRSRGIALDAARTLLTYGFVREILDQIPLAGLRASLAGSLLDRLPNAEYIRDLINE
jgi:Fe-S cluster assembly protein SufD